MKIQGLANRATAAKWRKCAEPAIYYVACLLLVMANTIAACALPLAHPRAITDATSAPANTAQSNTLPAFSDWRAAFLGEDGRAHAVTLDGKTDVVGPMLPDLTPSGVVIQGEGISPNGQWLAYDAAGLVIMNLATGKTFYSEGGLGFELAWAQDSSMLAINRGDGALIMADTKTGLLHPIPNEPENTVGNLLGWIDATHLAVTDIANQTFGVTSYGEQYVTSIAVAALDITTGQIHILTTIRSQQLGQPRFFLSPDGRTILFCNYGFRDYPYSPQVDEIDVATGNVISLPDIAQATGSAFSSLAWRGATDEVAVSANSISGMQTWLLTLDQDRSQPLPGSGYAAGWAPGTNLLVLTTGQDSIIDAEPFTLMALPINKSGQASSIIPLTGEAMTFPFLGYVRTE